MLSFVKILCTVWVLYLATVHIVLSQSCEGIAEYSETKSGADRLTTINEGNYTIQALITLTDNDKCNKVSREGLVRAMAMQYAINKFNNNTKYSDFATLGLQLDDVCRKLPTTMARGIEIISFHRPNSVCRADFLKCDAKPLNNVDVKVQRASAVIGTAMSFTTIPLASLMSLYSIPQVSPSASSRLLSKKDLYKSFFRTIPSDTNQIKAMLDVFKRFDWNYIFAIGSDDDYGKLGVTDLKKEAAEREICISKDEYIPFQSEKTGEKVKSVVKKIKQEPKAKVVVLFLYVAGLGDLILEEARKQGVHRVWLTSESWNPNAAIELSKPNVLHKLRNQTHGILSIAIKRHPMRELTTFMERQTRENWKCNLWLRKYIETRFKCVVDNLNGDRFSCKSDTPTHVLVDNVLKDIKQLPGNIDRLIDATTALGYAIYRATARQCAEKNPDNSEHCHIRDLETKKITAEMFKTDFVNEQGERVSFDDNGDPKTAFYTIENLVFNEEKQTLEFVPVGNWSLFNGSRSELQIDENRIQWPCQPGFTVVGRSRCCWKCHPCTGNNHTSKEMSEECVPCGNYHHTLDNKKCIETPIKWLEIDDPAGLSIVIISALGLLGSFATCAFMYLYWPLVTVHEKSPHLLTFVCVLLVVTFAYGPLHIIEPTFLFCNIRNGYFFVLLMIYTSFVLTKTEAMCENLQPYCDKFFRGNMTATQIFVLFLFALLEIASIVAWNYLDEKQIREFRPTGIHLIEKQCEVEFTAARLVSTFIPCIILIIATFCSFRERNADHSFYEPKFLSFSCIALCIIIVAFLPTFKYVDGVYKAVVLAFTMNVFGYTFVTCLILPKVYVGVVRKKRGMQEYPMKPGVTKKEKKEKKEKKKQEKLDKKVKNNKAKEESDISTNMTSSFKTKSTVDEAESEEVDSGKDAEAALEAVKMEENPPHDEKKAMEAGYSNEMFHDDDGEIEIAGGSPPPSYENSISRKQGEEEVESINTKC